MNIIDILILAVLGSASSSTCTAALSAGCSAMAALIGAAAAAFAVSRRWRRGSRATTALTVASRIWISPAAVMRVARERADADRGALPVSGGVRQRGQHRARRDHDNPLLGRRSSSISLSIFQTRSAFWAATSSRRSVHPPSCCVQAAGAAIWMRLLRRRVRAGARRAAAVHLAALRADHSGGRAIAAPVLNTSRRRCLTAS